MEPKLIKKLLILIKEGRLNRFHFGLEFELVLAYLEAEKYITQVFNGKYYTRRDLSNGLVTGYYLTDKGKNLLKEPNE
jgi:hypothetical protein